MRFNIDAEVPVIPFLERVESFPGWSRSVAALLGEQQGESNGIQLRADVIRHARIDVAVLDCVLENSSIDIGLAVIAAAGEQSVLSDRARFLRRDPTQEVTRVDPVIAPRARTLSYDVAELASVPQAHMKSMRKARYCPRLTDAQIIGAADMQLRGRFACRSTPLIPSLNSDNSAVEIPAAAQLVECRGELHVLQSDARERGDLSLHLDRRTRLPQAVAVSQVADMPAPADEWACLDRTAVAENDAFGPFVDRAVRDRIFDVHNLPSSAIAEAQRVPVVLAEEAGPVIIESDRRTDSTRLQIAGQIEETVVCLERLRTPVEETKFGDCGPALDNALGREAQDIVERSVGQVRICVTQSRYCEKLGGLPGVISPEPGGVIDALGGFRNRNRGARSSGLEGLRQVLNDKLGHAGESRVGGETQPTALGTSLTRCPLRNLAQSPEMDVARFERRAVGAQHDEDFVSEC